MDSNFDNICSGYVTKKIDEGIELVGDDIHSSIIQKINQIINQTFVEVWILIDIYR